MLKYANFLSTLPPLPTPFDVAPHSHNTALTRPQPAINKLSFFDDCNTRKKLETMFLQNFGRDIYKVYFQGLYENGEYQMLLGPSAPTC